MLETMRVIETALLGITAVILSVALIKILSTPEEEQHYDGTTKVMFVVMVVSAIIGVRMIWI